MLYEFESCEIDDLYITSKSFKKYLNIIVHYKGEDLQEFYGTVASILAKTITSFYENMIVKNFLTSNYFYFSDSERKEILKYCDEELNDNPKEKVLRFNLIFSSCFDYIKESKYMILDGFVNFRIKPYLREIDEIVDLSVDRFVIDKEYNEFTSLLKLYINTREAKTQIVHLIYQLHESILLDKNKQQIDISSNLFDAKYLSDISFSSNDYALNALLNLIPENLCIHLIDKEKDEFIETLEVIFEKRVYICKDCAICNIFNIAKSDERKIIIKE